MRDFKWKNKWYCLKVRSVVPGGMVHGQAYDNCPHHARSYQIPQWGSHCNTELFFRVIQLSINIQRGMTKIINKGIWRYGIQYAVLNYNGNNYNKQHGTRPRGWRQYTSRADTFWWRFEWKFFQSSFAVAILAWMPLAFSLVNRVLKSSPLESIMFSLCCPFSLSDKNSYKEKGKRLGIIKCFIHWIYYLFLNITKEKK